MNKKNTLKKILFFIIIQNNIYNMNNRFSFGNNNFNSIIIEKNQIKEWINNLALIYERTNKFEIISDAKEKILDEKYIETFFNIKDLENRSTRIILTFSKIIQNLENENKNKK